MTTKSAVSVDTLPMGEARTPYVASRAPLRPAPLVKLPIGAIEPRGWLRHQLELMRDGQAGRLPEVSKWTNAEKSAWRNPKGEGEYGWEELPYWLRGLTDLAYALRDEGLMNDARGWIEAIMASQEEDGYFGPRVNKTKLDLWPNMVVLNAVQSYHEATGDERALTFLARYFRWQYSLPLHDLFAGSWQKIRAGDNLESVLWLYNRKPEPWLLDLAKRIHERTVRWDLKVASWHGVNICQGYREPAIYYLLSGERAHLDAAERNYRQVMTLYGHVPGGMFGADENCREGHGGPRQAAETCSMVEFMHSFELLLAITGDPLHADRCEDVAFNSLPAAFTPDLKSMHYLTSPNMVQLDRGDKSPGLQNGGNMLTFDPRLFRCCQHNAHMGWPQLAQHLWMGTRDGGVAAVFYSASRVQVEAGGTTVQIDEATDYPFSPEIRFTLALPKQAEFPLYLRVPQWCAEPQVKINGSSITVNARPQSFLKLVRAWKDGDTVELTLPMSLAVERWPMNADAASVRYGPLWFSLKIAEEWTQYGGDEAWPAYEVRPGSPWNYGLVLKGDRPADSFTIERSTEPVAGQPFTPDAAPIRLKGTGRRIPAWTMDEKGLVTDPQGSPVRSSEPEEPIELIPMGCARLRISVFPVIGEGEDAVEWKPFAPPRHRASICWDVIHALSDGDIPASSNDHSTPRFTWVPRKGTTEWVTYRLDSPQKVSWSDVYWFDDTGIGYCRPPNSWRLYYRDGDAWREVENATGYDVELNMFNRVEFTPVTAQEFKLEADLRPEHSGGILEWRLGCKP